MTLRVRGLSEEEAPRLARMTRSRKLGAGLVGRARIIQHAVDGLSAPGIAARMGLCGATVRFWLKRFNERGLPGLEEEMRSGRPPTYTAEQRSAVIAAALSRPAELGLPFASWTLDRLVAYLGEKGIGMKRSRVSEVPGLSAGRGAEVAPGRDLVRGAGGPGFEHKRGRSSASTPPRPQGGVVVCLDEMGPLSARSYPGRRVVKPAPPKAQRAKQEIDYGRRGVAGHVFGAFQPAQGDALTAPYVGRTTANWVDFLGKLEAWIDPSVARVYAVMDNLNTHSATDVLLFALAHPRWEFVFQPKYAAYLNLIEPWWKILRSLALKGRRFETWAQIEEAVRRATAYWNEHKHPFLWGRRRRHRAARRPGVAVVPNIAIT